MVKSQTGWVAQRGVDVVLRCCPDRAQEEGVGWGGGGRQGWAVEGACMQVCRIRGRQKGRAATTEAAEGAQRGLEFGLDYPTVITPPSKERPEGKRLFRKGK